MKQIFIGNIIFILLFSLTGCAELKQLRIETAGQKATIEKLTAENQSCQDTLKQTEGKLQEKEAALAAAEDALKAKESDIMTKEGIIKAKEKELKEKEVKVKEQSDSFTKMQEAMKGELASKQVALKELEGKLTLTMVESILFDSGKADVKAEGVAALKKVADVLKNTKGQEVIVAGYTDNVPIKGMLAKIFPTNWELSAARAISVVNILVTNGVDPRLISASGFSEFRPVADNSTPEGRAQNRRMEIILMPKLK